jgi:hypothetical protein
MGNANVEARYRAGLRRALRRGVVSWSPGQFLPVLVGLFFAVFGMIGLIRTNFHPFSFTSRPETVMGFDQTSLLALIELVFGLALVALSGMLAWGGRAASLLAAGLLSLAFGAFLAMFSSSWQRILGGDASNGWLFIAAGVLTTLGGLTPQVRGRHPERVGPEIEEP